MTSSLNHPDHIKEIEIELPEDTSLIAGKRRRPDVIPFSYSTDIENLRVDTLSTLSTLGETADCF